MSSALSIGTELASVPFDQMIRNLLLAMVSAQNEANSSFIAGVQDLAEAEVSIKYNKTSDNSNQEQTISGNALAFGILPTLLQIQNGTIQIKMVITMQKTTEASVHVKAKGGWAFFSASVDAKYSSKYSYSVTASSFIEIKVAPAPPPEPLMRVIDKIVQDTTAEPAEPSE
ncbi:MAG: DUF2589 domain-containing protein [Candidatus Bathyarchaeota archaeon]|nr:DUF2589 domain-containing protein [Candidatus Bathyarchaeota archaeon]